MRMTPAVKNLLIINILFFASQIVMGRSLGINLDDYLGLHYVTAHNFGVWQLVTFMFMHANISHIFFNMFALWMFGTAIESALGTKRFVAYYLACGIGSGIIQELAVGFDLRPMISAVDALLSDPTTANIQDFLSTTAHAVSIESQQLINTFIKDYNATVGADPTAATTMAREFAQQYQQMYIDANVTVGASGAVFGILLAFGMIFPNMRIMLLFPPIPMKAKWFVLIYGLIELFGGIHGGDYDNVAHWAHIGGMIFGFILLRAWKISRAN